MRRRTPHGDLSIRERYVAVVRRLSEALPNPDYPLHGWLAALEAGETVRVRGDILDPSAGVGMFDLDAAGNVTPVPSTASSRAGGDALCP